LKWRAYYLRMAPLSILEWRHGASIGQSLSSDAYGRHRHQPPSFVHEYFSRCVRAVQFVGDYPRHLGAAQSPRGSAAVSGGNFWLRLFSVSQWTEPHRWDLSHGRADSRGYGAAVALLETCAHVFGRRHSRRHSG